LQGVGSLLHFGFAQRAGVGEHVAGGVEGDFAFDGQGVGDGDAWGNLCRFPF
jgi:hypothetical protein